MNKYNNNTQQEQHKTQSFSYNSVYRCCAGIVSMMWCEPVTPATKIIYLFI